MALHIVCKGDESIRAREICGYLAMVLYQKGARRVIPLFL